MTLAAAKGAAVDTATGGLQISELRKSYGAVQALKGVDLGIREGEFFTLLGPSGCGKTTLLRLIAGFEVPDGGQVVLGGRDMTGLSAAQRPVNTVFQSYALFPHLSVFENVAFGLRSQRVAAAEIQTRTTEALGLMRLDSFAQRRPDQLSGGQRQRVALARALVNAPKLLLLDEPMSALDAKLRVEVQGELRALQRRTGTTFILVTHDQDEAMSVSDRLAVLHDGRIGQIGSPDEVYAQPRTRFVAEFLGAANLIPGRRSGDCVVTPLGELRVAAPLPWAEGQLAVRPERIVVGAPEGTLNSAECVVRDTVFRGDHVEASLTPEGMTGSGLDLRVRVAAHPRLQPGERVRVAIPPEALVPLVEDAVAEK